jgi:PAS domain S-box-containing protein
VKNLSGNIVIIVNLSVLVIIIVFLLIHFNKARHKRKLTESKKNEEKFYRVHEESLKLVSIVENTFEAIAIFDLGEENLLRYVNPTWERLFGYSKDEVVDKKQGLILEAAQCDPELEKRLMECITKKEPFSTEMEWKNKEGTTIPVEVFSRPLFNKEGKIQFWLNTIRDITERKLTEAALLNSRKDLSRLLNSIAEGAYGVDTDGNCTFVNREFLDILGYQNEEEVLGKHIHELIHHSHCDGSPYPASECRMYKAYHTNQLVKVSDEVFWSKDGVAIPVEYRAHPITKDGIVIGAIATFNDITDRKLKEDEILRQQQQLRSLTSELIQTQSLERKRLATYLHDSIGQTLSVARMKIDVITAALSEKYPVNAQSKISPLGNKELINQLNDLSNLIKGSIQETRALTFELSPPILHDLGLVPALDWLVGEMEKQHKLKAILLNRAEKFRIADQVRDLLFDGTREMLMNVIKHAKATHVKVAVELVNSSVCISLKDNGVGFDTGAMEEQNIGKKSFGLYNLKERLHNVGGNIEIESVPGKGTCARLTAPLLDTSQNHLEK